MQLKQGDIRKEVEQGQCVVQQEEGQCQGVSGDVCPMSSKTKDVFKIVDMSVAQLRVSLTQLHDGICTVDNTVRQAEQSVSG